MPSSSAACKRASLLSRFISSLLSVNYQEHMSCGGAEEQEVSGRSEEAYSEGLVSICDDDIPESSMPASSAHTIIVGVASEYRSGDAS